MTLPFADLEAVYERLAAAIDQAGDDKAPVLLVKVVLKLAAESDDVARILEVIETCLADL
jgi:hypothetical protein